MAKTGPLGKAEKFYIEQHCDDRTPVVIAKELDRSVSSVEDYANKYKKLRTKAGGQMGRQPGSVVMTPNASMMADDHRSNRTLAPRKDCITTVVREKE
jgi:transposase